jgi:serine/threonine-protein kinase
LIRQSGRLTPERAIRIVLDVVAGLEAGRSLGIVHRDVKPGNFLITRDGMSKLADLGLAMVAAPGDSTIPRAAEGTVGYMAPEVIQNDRPVNHLSDIYSLGATLFHFVTGRLPFPAKSYREAIFNHLTKPLLLPDDTPIPAALWEVIVAMMAKDPKDRPRDYVTVRHLLTEALSNLNEMAHV